MRNWTQAAVRINDDANFAAGKAQISGLVLEYRTRAKRLNFASSQAQILVSQNFAVCKIKKRLQNSACRAFGHYAPMLKKFEEAGLAVQNLAA